MERLQETTAAIIVMELLTTVISSSKDGIRFRGQPLFGFGTMFVHSGSADSESSALSLGDGPAFTNLYREDIAKPLWHQNVERRSAICARFELIQESDCTFVGRERGQGT